LENRRSAALLLLLWAAFPASRAGADAGEKPSAFRAWFERQVETPTPLPVAAADAARQYRYVFVAGFLNEGFQIGYFNENRKALLDAGVKPDAIHVLFPRSGNGVEDNVTELRRSVPELAARGPQKLVLVGHSKGAVEALALVAAEAAFVRERVQAVFLVQGAFGGSGIADYITGSGHPLDARLPARRRAEFTVAVQSGKLLDLAVDDGFRSLTHRRAADLWDRLIPAAAVGVRWRLPEDVARKVFFIRGRRDPDKVSSIFTTTARYLRAYYGDNDGLVEVSDQWVVGTGTIIATLDADHFALTVARPVSAQSAATRLAFTRALLMQLAGEFDRNR
jgi:hypothetical protein